MFYDADLQEALTTLGQLLKDRNEAYDLVVIGGGAMLLLGFTAGQNRPPRARLRGTQGASTRAPRRLKQPWG